MIYYIYAATGIVLYYAVQMVP